MSKANRMKAETIVSKLFVAMTNRKQALLDGGFVVSDEIVKKNGLLDNFDTNGGSYREMLHAVEQTKSFIDFDYFINVIAKHKAARQNDPDYIQCKTVEKVLKCVKAFGFKDPRKLDNHTRYILINTLVNNGIITARNAFATLVKGYEFDALEEQQMFKVRANYTPGTGSTQISSTREMLRILRLTDGIKGAREAAIELTPEAKINMIQYFDELAKKAGIDNPDAPDAEGDVETDELAELDAE